MKLIFMICVIYGIPVIEGIPNNYEQMLEPRGITDSFYDWWYGEPENDEYETISQDDRQDTTWEEINKSESQYTQFIPNESGKRVIPVDKITPQRKVEPIEDLLEELNEEIRQSSDNEEKKDIMNTLTEIKSDLQETPSRFVNVMINKAWRVFDIGNIGSSRRTRSIESIGMLTTIIQWLLSILSMSIFSWHGGQNNTSHEALIPKWFTSNQNGAPVNVQSSSVIGLPGDKNDKTLDIGKLRGDQDVLVVFLKKDKTEDNKDKVDYDIKGDTQDEKINNINELLKKNNLSNKTKLLILVELTKMYDDDLDDKTKKRIIYLILVISKAPEFKEILEVIGKSEDAEYEKARNLFIKERNSLQKKYDDIENSTSKDIDKEKDIISKTNNKPSTEYHIITVDENMKLKQDKEIDKDKLKDLLKNIGNSHMSKDHANDVKQSVISAHEHDASKNTSLPDKVEPDKTAKLLQGEKEISQVSQSAFPSSKVTTDPLSKKEQPNKFEIAENHDHVALSSPHSDSDKSIVNLDESLNESPKPSIPKNHVQRPTNHEPHSHHNENLKESHNNKAAPPYSENHDHFPIQDSHPPENTYYEQNQPPHDTLPFDGKVEEHPSIENPSSPDIKNYQSPLPLIHHSPPANESLPYNDEDYNTLTAHEPPLFDGDIGNQKDPTDDQLSTDKPYHDSVDSKEEDKLNEQTENHCRADEDRNQLSNHESLPLTADRKGEEDLVDENFNNEPSNTDHNQLYPYERIPHDVVSKDENDLNEKPLTHGPSVLTTDNETLQNPFIPPENEYDPYDEDDYIDHPHSPYNSQPENHDAFLDDEENPFNNPEYHFISTYYPYNETSDRVKFYYDPQKKTYKDKNSTTELDDIFEKIMSITEHDKHTPQTVKSKIVEDLVECNDFAMELKEDTEKKLMRTIEEVGKSPKFTFIEDLKKLKTPTDYAKHVLNLFGKVPGEVENTSQPNPEIVNTQWQSTLNGPYTKISSTTYTHSYNCPQVSQPINSMKRSKNLREKIKFYIDTQNALKLLNTDINQEAYRQYKQGVETELQDTQYDNLRREFLDKVPSQDILSQLRELNKYLTNNNIVGKNDQEEKDAIRGYLSKPN